MRIKQITNGIVSAATWLRNYVVTLWVIFLDWRSENARQWAAERQYYADIARQRAEFWGVPLRTRQPHVEGIIVQSWDGTFRTVHLIRVGDLPSDERTRLLFLGFSRDHLVELELPEASGFDRYNGRLGRPRGLSDLRSELRLKASQN